MAYMLCYVENVPAKGTIVVSCSSTGENSAGADNIKIHKRAVGGDWKMIKEYAVSTYVDMGQTYTDVNVASGTTYEYHIDLCRGTSVIESQSIGVSCVFRGLVISNANQIWKTEFGTVDSQQKVEVKKNFDVQYIKTLNGRFPRRVSNSAQNYYTGTATGLFLPSDVCGAPSIDGANQYKEAFLDFLCDGGEKLLRTGEGKAFVVSVDGTPQENWNAYQGLSTITFNWTQIGDADVMNIAYEAGGGGSYILQSKTVKAGRVAQKVVADSGYYGLAEVSIEALPSATGVNF